MNVIDSANPDHFLTRSKHRRESQDLLPPAYAVEVMFFVMCVCLSACVCLPVYSGYNF